MQKLNLPGPIAQTIVAARPESHQSILSAWVSICHGPW